jgi:biotin operon repressor
MDTTAERAGAILRANKGVPFCDACLALAVGVSLEAMQTAIQTLKQVLGYRVNSKRRCSVCQRVKIAISAPEKRRRMRTGP